MISHNTMILFLKNLAFTILLPGTLAVYIPCRLLSSGFILPADWALRHYAGLLPLLAGASIYAWCIWDFATIGRGTPAPIDAPKVLVVHGLYRHVRNPMYLGVLLVITGWAVFFGSATILIYAAAVWLGFHTFVILVEEPSLRRRFAGSYENYCHNVRRWLPGKGIE